MVSVIMITYNQEKTIDEAVRGVLSQKTDFDFELIIANDASTDGTGERVRKWSEMYPERIVAINRKKNLGLQRNFLDALSHAKGKYIAICEGDDWWCSSKKLAMQVGYMEEDFQCTLCFHRVVNYYEDDGSMSLSGSGIPSDMSFADLAKANVISNLSVMYRASVLLSENLEKWVADLRLFDYALHMISSFSYSSNSIHYINEPMAVYRQRSQGIWSGGKRDAQLRMAMATRIKLIDFLRNKILEDLGNVIIKPDDLLKRRINLSYSAVDNLTDSMNQIALSLLIEYETQGLEEDDPRIDFVKRLIFNYNKNWDDDKILKEKERRRILEAKMAKKGVSKILTGLRKVLSRWMPVPTIAKGVKVPD